jgi:hypothetical protein
MGFIYLLIQVVHWVVFAKIICLNLTVAHVDFE